VPGNVVSASELHGESGNDFLYGGGGNDVIYGDGQNDTIVGGYGNDWISGGTGDDGILGDDGRLFSSIVTTTYGEPLYGLAPVSAANVEYSIQGGAEDVMTNVPGTLLYTAVLTPDNLDPSHVAAGTATPRPLYANDIVYGGLGNDSIHGGAGDDAISGAEALPLSYTNNYTVAGALINTTAPIRSDYAHPYNPGNVLGYSAATTYQAQYDQANPLRKITLAGLDWLLDFDATQGPTDTFWLAGTTAYPAVPTDGNDIVFGDLGNDWIVGGTGRDTMWGGWGNDVLNADDVLTTAGGENTGTDTNPSYEDFAYGGAGRDVLIANTGGDRLVDWSGEFNSYLTPFSPFGMATVSRDPSPGLQNLLVAFALSQGADRHLGAEPLGEIGMVTQSDAAWGDQKGSPRDPQPGNSSGARDVLRTAGTLKIGQGPDSPAAPALLVAGAPAPHAMVVGGMVGAGVTVTSPAALVATSINRASASTFSITLIGPAGFAAAWAIGDGVHTLTGTTTIGADGTKVIVVDASSLADGAIALSVVETDPFGNTASAAVTVVKDTVGPSLTAAISATTIDLGGSLVVAWTANDTAGAVSVSAMLDDGTRISNGAIDTFALRSGIHTATITATDAVGNITTRTLSFTIRPTATGILASINDGSGRGLMTSTEKATLVSSINLVIGASGGSGASKLRSFINTVLQATSAQLAPSYRALLLDWANDLLTRI
jgi:Ca2+-binding RTX toxin-like protein